MYHLLQETPAEFIRLDGALRLILSSCLPEFSNTNGILVAQVPVFGRPISWLTHKVTGLMKLLL